MKVVDCLHSAFSTGTETRGAGQDGLAHPAGLAGPDLPVCLQLLVFPAFLAYLLSQGSRESLGFLGNMEYQDNLGRLAVVAGRYVHKSFCECFVCSSLARKSAWS